MEPRRYALSPADITIHGPPASSRVWVLSAFALGMAFGGILGALAVVVLVVM